MPKAKNSKSKKGKKSLPSPSKKKTWGGRYPRK